ncbi:hypothetical protein O6H91_Y279200 [Diphasiastrum complanatum]|nr:hypothetical protein O6H91_Y279200 [Diphasiastrum complanatum]
MKQMPNSRYMLRSSCGLPCSTSMASEQEMIREDEINQYFQIDCQHTFSCMDNVVGEATSIPHVVLEADKTLSPVAHLQDTISGSSQQGGGTSDINPQIEHPTDQYDCQSPPIGDAADRGIVVSHSTDTLPSSKKSVAKSERKEKEVILGAILETGASACYHILQNG